MNSVHNFLFYKGYCTVYFRAKENSAVTLPHSAQRKHEFLGKFMVRLKTDTEHLCKRGDRVEG